MRFSFALSFLLKDYFCGAAERRIFELAAGEDFAEFVSASASSITE